MAQAFARLGSRVTLVAKGGRFLVHDLPEAAEFVAKSFRHDGITVVSDAPTTADFDAVLVAIGRTPNVESLNLSAAGVSFDGDKGVLVDEYLRTTNRRIFAAGDVTSLGVRFTHAADAMARVVLRNALFAGRATFDPTSIPHCTFTDPEVAAVGDTSSDNREWHLPFSGLDRAQTDGAEGFLKLFTAARSDRILGAACVGPNAGELIGTVSAAMANGIGLAKLGGAVFPYPTYTEAVRKLADQFNRGKLTPLVNRLLRAWLRWRR
jgi:pyruvate/2-oxoglutarate dehydrogenase complex dihydrolipoamide dehydrogenase (E3) component